MKQSRNDLEKLSIIDAAVLAGLFPSKAEARRNITNGGLYLNNIRFVMASITVKSCFLDITVACCREHSLLSEWPMGLS